MSWPRLNKVHLDVKSLKAILSDHPITNCGQRSSAKYLTINKSQIGGLHFFICRLIHYLRHLFLSMEITMRKICQMDLSIPSVFFPVGVEVEGKGELWLCDSCFSHLHSGKSAFSFKFCPCSRLSFGHITVPERRRRIACLQWMFTHTYTCTHCDAHTSTRAHAQTRRHTHTRT